MRKFNAFQEPIACFAPGAEMLFHLAQSFTLFGKAADASRAPAFFVVNATYSYGPRSIVERTDVDLRPHLNSANPPEPLVDKLEEIKKAIEKIKYGGSTPCPQYNRSGDFRRFQALSLKKDNPFRAVVAGDEKSWLGPNLLQYLAKELQIARSCSGRSSLRGSVEVKPARSHPKLER